MAKCSNELVIDLSELEPVQGVELGFCFEDDKSMESWRDSIKDFRDECKEEKNKF